MMMMMMFAAIKRKNIFRCCGKNKGVDYSGASKTKPLEMEWLRSYSGVTQTPAPESLWSDSGVTPTPESLRSRSKGFVFDAPELDCSGVIHAFVFPAASKYVFSFYCCKHHHHHLKTYIHKLIIIIIIIYSSSS